MFRKMLFPVLMILVLTLAACQPQPDASMPNPASVFCEENGGTLEIRSAEDGSQSGVCVFADASECDEWAYMRGECKPGDSLATPTAEADTNANMPNPASVFCEENGGQVDIRTAADGSQAGVCVFADASECDEWAYQRGECKAGEAFRLNADGWKLYRSVKLGYTFAFPADATIIVDDNPTHSVSVEGPKVGDTMAYVFTIAHPAREDFQPAADADLAQWLADHNLGGDNRQDGLIIGGTTAVHYRHERSPQSYAFDRYFFAHGGQLFQVVIGHTNDQEDWDVYNAFLQSWRFDAR